MEEKLKQIKNMLEKYGQEQLLKNYEKLDEENKKILLEQIQTINFEQIEELYKNVGKTMEKENVKIEPIPYLDKSKISEEDKKVYFEEGANEIKSGKLAIVTMAGGQGTRLRA